MATHKKLEKADILHLAKLANLSVSEEEIAKYQAQLEQTLAYVENMEELDTSNVEGMSHSATFDNVYFEDGADNPRGFSEDQALANAKAVKGTLFKVPRIL
jgi:aspartyl-tRNA(Asn)/glutamyl-tRNA(Gln) amidotransferase subunit C